MFGKVAATVPVSGASESVEGIEMRVGVLREIKPDERRIALTPAGAQQLTQRGHDVIVERGAGVGSGFEDDAFVAAGARIRDVDAVWDESELLLKVKELVPSEHGRLRADQTLFGYLHLAVEPELTTSLVEGGGTAIAYEMVQDARGGYPLLAPMSEVAGRLAAQMGAWAMTAAGGGAGVLPGGVPGVQPAHVVVIGGGVVGTNAALIAAGLGAEVVVLETSLDRIRQLDAAHGDRLTALVSDEQTVAEHLSRADLVVGAVLINGARAPRVVSRDLLKTMRRGSVVVDVAIDQGGCFESSRPTTHSDPTYELDGVVHYCVANMPGAVPVTATRALTNATMRYVLALADRGTDAALEADPGLAAGVNVRGGAIAHPVIEQAQRISLAAAD
jgi:alanine dehydrogenase